MKHEDMWVAVVMNNEDALNGPAHAKIFVVVLQALQSRRYRRVLFGLRLLGAA